MNPSLLINFTDGIRDASPYNLALTVTSVSIGSGQFGDGGNFAVGTISTPPLDISADFTLELWIAAGSSGILWDMSQEDQCPVPCGIAQPANKIRFVQLNLGVVEEII